MAVDAGRNPAGVHPPSLIYAPTSVKNEFAVRLLWNGDERFRRTYLESIPGYFDTADAGYVDDDGYLWVMGRTDDVINVAGHRLSTGSMEEVVAVHPAVAECAVIGYKDKLKGELPCCLIVLKNGTTISYEQITREVMSLVRERIGAVASMKRVLVVERLPKTRSGKILRSTIKRIADGEEYAIPATIEDPSVLAEIEWLFREGTQFRFPEGVDLGFGSVAPYTDRSAFVAQRKKLPRGPRERFGC